MRTQSTSKPTYLVGLWSHGSFPYYCLSVNLYLTFSIILPTLEWQSFYLSSENLHFFNHACLPHLLRQRYNFPWSKKSKNVAMQIKLKNGTNGFLGMQKFRLKLKKWSKRFLASNVFLLIYFILPYLISSLRCVVHGWSFCTEIICFSYLALFM